MSSIKLSRSDFKIRFVSKEEKEATYDDTETMYFMKKRMRKYSKEKLKEEILGNIKSINHYIAELGCSPIVHEDDEDDEENMEKLRNKYIKSSYILLRLNREVITRRESVGSVSVGSV